jgi:fibronectin-binding autotransporter adhesin
MGTISRVTTWSTGDTLTAADLNGEFDNILSTANGSLNADNLGVTAGIASALKAVVLDSNKDFADGTGSNQIRNLTISGSLKIGTTFLPDASGGADLGSSSLEWGDLYIADDKFINLGSDQNILIGYDETTTDSLKIAATEGAALAITLMADEGDDAGDEWKLNVADGGTITLGNDIASAGTFVTHLTLTPHATVASSTLALAGGLTVAGATQANGTVTVGADDQGYDVKLFGDTASAYLLWDTSADKLLTAGGATIDIVKDKLLIGGVAVTTTAAELNFLDTSSAGTVVASKAVVVDSNKDIASFRNVTLTGELDAATGDFSGDVDVDGTLEADAITLGGTALGSLYSPIAGSTSIVTVGTIGTGTWQGTAVASAYLDADTAHLSTTQTFSGAKTFSAAAQFSSTVTVGVDDTGYDVKFFGATSGSSLLWDESADDLIFTNAGLAVGSDATGDIYYRNSSGFLARLGASTDGYVLTTGGAGTIPAWEAAPGSGSFSGPGSSTDNAVVRFNGTGGNTGQNSGVTIDDSNNATGFANLTLSGELDAATGDFSGDVDVDGTLEADAITIGGTGIGSIYGVVAGSSSIVTTGALDSGSITSGFGTIDTGSSAITTTGVITGGTVEATTDTAAGDNAAIGYTAAEGLILTGQGSTSDVTIKNDADATVLSIPTGSTNVGIGTTAPGSYKNKSGAQVLTILNSDNSSSNNSAELSLSGAASNTQCTLGFYEATTLKGQILCNLNNDGELDFKTNGDNTRMKITSAGNVGIGTTPTKKLQVKVDGGTDDGLSFVTDGDHTTNEYFCIGGGTPSGYSAQIRFMRGGTSGLTGAESMRIDTSGNVGVNTAPGGMLHVKETGTAGLHTTYVEKSNASATGNFSYWDTTRTTSTAFNYGSWTSGTGGTSKQEFLLTGDGNGKADGTWQDNQYDYAEYFESATGVASELGRSVVLDDGKMRYYDASTDDATNIIGITRPKKNAKGPSIHNVAWNGWHERYVTDDFGQYAMEDVTVWSWDEIDAIEASEGVEAVEGRKSGGVYERDELAKDPDWTPPPDATSSTQSVRKQNPDYDPSLADDYKSREDRDEWWLIGLLGQVQIKSDEPTNPRWIKMRQISDSVDMWMIR